VGAGTGLTVDPGAGFGRRLTRSFLDRPVPVVARDLLGRVLIGTSPEGVVAVRLTEVEAYRGADDAASHAYRGRTPRTQVMFGPAGHLYLYFVYGMHWCANIVTGPEGIASAVLLRGGEVVRGAELAAVRRPSVRRAADLAKGPAGLVTALGWGPATNGDDLVGGPHQLRAGRPVPDGQVSVGPRVGITRAADLPWRFVVDGAPGVTVYRPGVRRRSRTTGMGD
jgi:DNA-3-methyladenine glycosylase